MPQGAPADLEEFTFDGYKVGKKRKRKKKKSGSRRLNPRSTGINGICGVWRR